ncbi:TIGR01777 family oxidoreductase [Bacillus sp. 2205SS5-2]|uniref:TIGR01777 family oxidoreductase n=1 Tax=Bacillus sp. 2205SS5-2 TaxID=3109031 RepID=UPI003004D4CB
MRKKVVLAGGTGFIGQYFQKQFEKLGYEVIIISRQPPHVIWEDFSGVARALENAELLLNLAGKSVNCRYNEKNKAKILNSRIETTELLGKAIQQCETPPQLWLNSSSATIYRHAEDRPMTEETGELGEGFSVDVARQWEESFFSFSLPNTRQVALRISIVLGSTGGVMVPYTHMVKFGLGGVQGPGNQKFSWIHIEDLFSIVLFLSNRKEVNGIINCSAPSPITNAELMKELRNAMKRPYGLPSPKWMLEFGARFIGTETELILKSRWVVPEKLLAKGFTFTYNTIEEALNEIVHA